MARLIMTNGAGLRFVIQSLILLAEPSVSIGLAAQPLDLSQAVVVVRPGELPNAEMAAATVLIEELEARTGIRLGRTSEWTADQTVIAITSGGDVPAWNVDVPARDTANGPEAGPEGYRLFVDKRSVVWVIGKDPRGALYGVGALLRHLDWDDGKATLPADLDIATSPSYPIRGHQLGFRTQANSWDAWTPAQFDQYIPASSPCSASTVCGARVARLVGRPRRGTLGTTHPCDS